MWWWTKNASVTATIMVVKNIFFYSSVPLVTAEFLLSVTASSFGLPDSSTEKSRVEEQEKKDPLHQEY